MGYRMMGRGHAALVLMRERLRDQVGQGTVEYVALILLVAMVMAAVASASTNDSGGKTIAKKVTDTLMNSIDKVGKSAP
jgi:Flp pilus assembly pilin Flp